MIKGFTCSAFDLCHPGHLLMLEEAKSKCDYLVVGLHIDPSLERSNKNRPVESAYERWVRLKACKFVDEIIPYETEEDLVNILLTQKIDLRILGEEYKDKMFTGRGLVKEYFNERAHNYSSSGLRKRWHTR